MVNSPYLVQICYEAPYPAQKDYTVTASNFGLAVRRAFDAFRKDKITNKRQKKVNFRVFKLGNIGADINENL